MSGVRLTWLDVFVTGPLTGNPLAVVWGADAWDGGAMQALAAELSLSETVDVLPPEGAADARLRILAPTRPRTLSRAARPGPSAPGWPRRASARGAPWP